MDKAYVTPMGGMNLQQGDAEIDIKAPPEEQKEKEEEFDSLEDALTS